MAEPFIGEIRMFAGTFAPRGWAFCDGQLLSITQNEALFSLFGTTYGGDGRTTFGLPEARGRVAIHVGQGPGLSNRPLGQKAGVEDVTINENQLPGHSHEPMKATSDNSSQPSASGNMLASAGFDPYRLATPTSALAPATAITNTGGGGSHNNLQPFLGINCIVALVGIFPARN